MNEIYEYFDMCYVITAPHLTERHKYIENLFKSYKIDKYKFIYGPYGKDINIQEFKTKNLVHKEKMNDDIFKYPIATFLTHKMAWEDMINNKYKNCIFFEDDVYFVDNFKKNFKNFMNNLPNYWSVLNFGWVGPKPIEKKWRHLNEYVYLDEYFNGGAPFYGLNRKSCSQLIQNSFPLTKAVDGYIGDITNVHTKRKGLILFSLSPKEKFADDRSHGENALFESTFKP